MRMYEEVTYLSRWRNNTYVIIPIVTSDVYGSVLVHFLWFLCLIQIWQSLSMMGLAPRIPHIRDGCSIAPLALWQCFHYSMVIWKCTSITKKQEEKIVVLIGHYCGMKWSEFYYIVKMFMADL
jgi:hypothetical protein